MGYPTRELAVFDVDVFDIRKAEEEIREGTREVSEVLEIETV